MRFGLALPQYDYSIPGRSIDWASVKDVAQKAEDLGFASVWLSDHLFLDTAKYGGPPTRYGAMECFTTVAALGAVTSRVQIGTLVVCNDLRHPAVVAKMAATTHLICDGRFTLGLGAGWYEPEFEAAGIGFFPPGERVSRLAEAVQIVSGMMSGGPFDFHGKHYAVHDAINLPVAAERPRLVVGGKGDRVVRIAARYADSFNSVWAWTPEAFAERLRLLDDEAERNGRSVARSVGLYTLMGVDDDDLERRWRTYREVSPPGTAPGLSAAEWGADKLVGDPRQIAAKIEAFAALGVEEVILGFGLLPFQLADESQIEMFAKEFIS